jgi:hypothetical protein
VEYEHKLISVLGLGVRSGAGSQVNNCPALRVLWGPGLQNRERKQEGIQKSHFLILTQKIQNQCIRDIYTFMFISTLFPKALGRIILPFHQWVNE